MGKYRVEKGTQIGKLFPEFYTERSNGQKKLRYTGYILLGIFNGAGYGIEIKAYEIPPHALPEWSEKKIYRIRSGRKSIGYFIRETNFLRGKIDIGGLEVKISAFPEGKAYTIELMDEIECGVVRLL